MSTRCPTDVDRFVGQRIRLARRMSKMSQQRLGEQIGVTYQQIQKYENGSDRIGAGRLHQVAIAVDQPIEFFFNQAEEQGTGRTHVLLDDGVQRLIASASRIKSRKLLDNLTQIAETFAASEVSEPAAS